VRRRTSNKTRAERLCIPEHALRALEHQARRHYRRWWLEQAERIARKVIRFDVGRAGAWFILGDIEMRRMNWQRAFGHFQQSVDCCRADALAWCRGAEALVRLGELERAEQWLQSAVSVAPPGDSPGARRARQYLARHRAEFERARSKRLEEAASQAPTMKLKAFQEGGATNESHPKVASLQKYRQEKQP
jgi:tetratricopeptide (TPR) repeat protein